MGLRHFTQVTTHMVCDDATALGCFSKLNTNTSQCFLFESMQGAEHWSRYSFIGLPASEYYVVRDHEMAHYKDGVCVSSRTVSDPLDEIQQLHTSFRITKAEGVPRFSGGLVGYFGYECVRYVEPRLHALPKRHDPIGAPDIYLMLCTELVAYDNLHNQVQIICHYEGDSQAAQQKAQERLDAIAEQLRQPLSQKLPPLGPQTSDNLDAQLASVPGGDAYREAVRQCQQYILAGDVYQVVPSSRASVPFTGDTTQLYRALRLVSPSPYMYYLRLEGLDIVGASPETMVRLEDNTLTVRPLAGTARRGRTLQEDEQRAAELVADPKERAEHNMLVDLARNDLGQIAATGTVEVSKYMQVEYFSHVMHLVSTVRATLGCGLHAIDAIKATLPAGTLSGAPKIRAMEIINQMEPYKRGVYSGAVGYLDWSGNVDTAIPIRTFVIAQGKVHLQAGAGIVADSDPEKEWQETLNKRRSLFSALALMQE